MKSGVIRFFSLACIATTIVASFSTRPSYATPFVPGDLAVVVAAASASNTTASVVELNTSSAGQTPVQTISIDGSSSNAIRVSGSATSTLYASHSNDRSLFTFTGANVDPSQGTNGTANANTLNPRAVVTINAAGTVTIPATTYTGTSGNQTRSASTLDNSTWFIGDQGGFYTNGASTASPTGNVRSVKAFGGTMYAFTASASSAPVGVISAATGGTFTGLPGLANGTTAAQDFYLVSSTTNGSAYDELYVLSATSNTAGTIAKFSFIDSNADSVLDTWTANGTYTTTFGGFGLAAALDGSGADLYVTSGQGALTANSLIKLFDQSGYNAAINITTANNVTLYTTGTGTILKGVDFAPVAVPEPSVCLLAALAAVGCVCRPVRRRDC